VTAGWGPQHAADLPGGLRIGSPPGRYWWAVAAAAGACLLLAIEVHSWIGAAVVGGIAIAVGIGCHEGHTGMSFACGRWGPFAAATLLFPVIGIGYSAAYFGVRNWPRFAAAQQTARAARWEAEAHAAGNEPEPLSWPTIPGGFFGVDDAGQPITANPRGAALVIGPPGSGKTTCVVENSVAYAPGPCVSTSIKAEVMTATAAIRAQRGTCWWFDPGGAGGDQPPAGVQQLRWTPLVDVNDWPAALSVAARLTGPFRPADGGGSSDHWIDKAEQWLAVYLFAASLGPGLEAFAEWCRGPDAAAEEVATALLEAEVVHSDRGAHFANSVLTGIMATQDKERSSIASTLSRITKLYNNPLALDAGTDPNFDANAFVRSADTVYITAPSAAQKDYAPLIAGLLESIRTAQEMRRQRVDRGEETQDVPVTFVLDEAANTAPIPLPAITSTAGGQGLHLVVAIQEPNQVRASWGQSGEGFLTMFPDKLILSGMADERWATMLSRMSGEYDRMTTNLSAGSRSQQQRTGLLFDVQTGSSTADPAVTYSTQRTAQLSVADITTQPAGRALFFGRHGWKLIHLRQFDAARPLGADASHRASALSARPAYLRSGPSWLAQRATPKRLLIAAVATILIVGGGLIAAQTGHHEPAPAPIPPPAPDGPSIAAQAPSLDSRPPPQWDVAQPDTLDGYWTSPPDCDDRVTMWVIEDHNADSQTVTLRTGCFTPAWRDEIQSRAAQFAFSVPMDGTIALLDPRGVFERYGTIGPLQIVQVSNREGCGDARGQLRAGPIPFDCVYHRLTK